MVPNCLLNDPAVSFKAKGLFAYIQSKNNDWDFTVELISRQTSDGIESVRTGLIELEKSGYLTREKIYKDGRISDVQYTIHSVAQILISGNQILENQGTENQLLENRIYFSNKEDSNKEEEIKKKTNTTTADPTKVESRFKLKVNDNGILVCELLSQACREYYKSHPEVMPKDMYVPFIERWSKQNRAGVPAYVNKKDWNLDGQIKLWVHEKKKPPINIAFEVFWEEYGLKEQKEPCIKIWNHLSDTDRKLIMEDLPRYFETLRDPKFKKYPKKYLTEKNWLDERERKDKPVEHKQTATEALLKKHQMQKI